MEITENGVVYLVYSQNGVEVKEFVRMESSITLSYDGDSIHIIVHGPDSYNGPVTLSINGSETVVDVTSGVGELPYGVTGYYVIDASLDGYTPGRLEIGSPPSSDDKIAELESKVAQLQTQNDQLIITVGDLALGGGL